MAPTRTTRTSPPHPPPTPTTTSTPSSPPPPRHHRPNRRSHPRRSRNPTFAPPLASSRPVPSRPRRPVVGARCPNPRTHPSPRPSSAPRTRSTHRPKPLSPRLPSAIIATTSRPSVPSRPSSRANEPSRRIKSNQIKSNQIKSQNRLDSTRIDPSRRPDVPVSRRARDERPPNDSIRPALPSRTNERTNDANARMIFQKRPFS